MSLKFYRRVVALAWREPRFRAIARHEAWILFKQKLPARLVTPRSHYIYCPSMVERGKGRWLPPRSLHLRPSAYGIAFDEAGRVLMVGDNFFGSRFSFPGGAVEPGETLIQALQREFIEETGLTVKVGAVVTNMDEFAIMPTGQAIHGLLHFYLVEVTGGILMARGNGFDTGSAAYMDIDALPTVQLGHNDNLPRFVERARQLRLLQDYSDR